MTLSLHEFHHSRGARFSDLNGAELVSDYGDMPAEHAALHQTAGVLDLSFRARLCLVGADRVRFLHGQITNDVKRLRIGEGCCAALVTAKGRMESDLKLIALADELLLDFEPGLSAKVAARLEKYIVADDVQVVDAAPHYGLFTVQGPKAADVVQALGLFPELPGQMLSSVKCSDVALGEIYLVNHPRLDGTTLGVRWTTNHGAASTPNGLDKASAPSLLAPPQDSTGTSGFDLFVPIAALGAVADKLIAVAKAFGGRACGWTAFETARIEAGIPRFGADMGETNIPLECGIEMLAVSYNKGCYIGQEVINRIHSIGHVNRELHRLRLADDLNSLPAKGDKLFKDDKEAGYITSAVKSPRLQVTVALGYIRRESSQAGTELTLRTAEGESRARIVGLTDIP